MIVPTNLRSESYCWPDTLAEHALKQNNRVVFGMLQSSREPTPDQIPRSGAPPGARKCPKRLFSVFLMLRNAVSSA